MRPMIACFVVAMLPAATLAVDTTAFARCRALVDPAQRLGCYDALPLAPAAATQAGVAPSSPGPATGAPATSALSKAPSAEQRFGLPAPAEEAQLIQSHIPGRFNGWEAGDRITLANGQVWQVSDGSRGVFNLLDPKVRVRRGAVGSYFLEIEGQNRSPRVRRIR